MRKRGFDKRPLASISKLLILLTKNLTVDQELLQGMRISSNSIIQKRLERLPPDSLEEIMDTIYDNNIELYLNVPSATLQDAIAHGYVEADTASTLRLLSVIGNRIKNDNNLIELATASISKRGTGESILTPTLSTHLARKYTILAAKTGTLASRSTTTSPGVFGKLFTVVLYRKHDAKIIPIIIRVYPDDLRSPICQAEGCVSHKYLAGLLNEAIVLIDDI